MCDVVPYLGSASAEPRFNFSSLLFDMQDLTEIIHAADGSLRQLLLPGGTLLNIVPFTSAAFTLSVFPPHQVAAKGEDGLYSFRGTPCCCLAVSFMADTWVDLTHWDLRGTRYD